MARFAKTVFEGQAEKKVGQSLISWISKRDPDLAPLGMGTNTSKFNESKLDLG
jgi:hypothetical protein